MTRKDYRLLASALRRARPTGDDPNSPAWQAWDHCVSEISRALAGDNSRFDEATFTAACEE